MLNFWLLRAAGCRRRWRGRAYIHQLSMGLQAYSTQDKRQIEDGRIQHVDWRGWHVWVDQTHKSNVIFKSESVGHIFKPQRDPIK